MSSTLKTTMAAAAAALAFGMAGAAWAGGPFDYAIDGQFHPEDVVTSGVFVNLVGGLSPLDNTGAAVFGTGTNADLSTYLTWGSSAASMDHLDDFSFLTWVNSDPGTVASDTPFLLGRLLYHNATSDSPTIIFGGSLKLEAGNVDVTGTSLDFGILSTLNTGLSLKRDADFLTFLGFDQTFNVFEGHTAAIDVYGQIVGDPMSSVIFFELTPGFEKDGFIGMGVGVPEPATWGLMILGFGAAGWSLRRRRAVSAARG